MERTEGGETCVHRTSDHLRCHAVTRGKPAAAKCVPALAQGSRKQKKKNKSGKDLVKIPRIRPDEGRVKRGVLTPRPETYWAEIPGSEKEEKSQRTPPETVRRGREPGEQLVGKKFDDLGSLRAAEGRGGEGTDKRLRTPTCWSHKSCVD